jgi:hypothetical protein
MGHLPRQKCLVTHVNNVYSFTRLPTYVTIVEFYLLGYYSALYVENQATFQENISPRFLLKLFFDPEDGSDMFLQNFQWTELCYTPEDRSMMIVVSIY